MLLTRITVFLHLINSDTKNVSLALTSIGTHKVEKFYNIVTERLFAKYTVQNIAFKSQSLHKQVLNNTNKYQPHKMAVTNFKC